MILDYALDVIEYVQDVDRIYVITISLRDCISVRVPYLKIAETSVSHKRREYATSK